MTTHAYTALNHYLYLILANPPKHANSAHTRGNVTLICCSVPIIVFCDFCCNVCCCPLFPCGSKGMVKFQLQTERGQVELAGIVWWLSPVCDHSDFTYMFFVLSGKKENSLNQRGREGQSWQRSHISHIHTYTRQSISLENVDKLEWSESPEILGQCFILFLFFFPEKCWMHAEQHLWEK